MYHFDFKVWQSYFEVKMVHVRTQLEQLAPGQKCPGAQFMQFQWHTMSFKLTKERRKIVYLYKEHNRRDFQRREWILENKSTPQFFKV